MTLHIMEHSLWDLAYSSITLANQVLYLFYQTIYLLYRSDHKQSMSLCYGHFRARDMFEIELEKIALIKFLLVHKFVKQGSDHFNFLP